MDQSWDRCLSFREFIGSSVLVQSFWSWVLYYRQIRCKTNRRLIVSGQVEIEGWRQGSDFNRNAICYHNSAAISSKATENTHYTSDERSHGLISRSGLKLIVCGLSGFTLRALKEVGGRLCLCFMPVEHYVVYHLLSLSLELLVGQFLRKMSSM